MEIGKQTFDSIDEILKKAPSVKDIEIRCNLGKLKRFNRNLPGRKMTLMSMIMMTVTMMTAILKIVFFQ